MDAITAIWATQPVVVLTVALIVVSLSFRRLGAPLLVRWLGLTDRTAGRLSAAILIGLWTVYLLAYTLLSAETRSMSSLGSIAGRLVGVPWWILLLIALPFVLSRLRK